MSERQNRVFIAPKSVTGALNLFPALFYEVSAVFIEVSVKTRGNSVTSNDVPAPLIPVPRNSIDNFASPNGFPDSFDAFRKKNIHVPVFLTSIFFRQTALSQTSISLDHGNSAIFSFNRVISLYADLCVSRPQQANQFAAFHLRYVIYFARLINHV